MVVILTSILGGANKSEVSIRIVIVRNGKKVKVRVFLDSDIYFSCDTEHLSIDKIREQLTSLLNDVLNQYLK